MHIKATWLQNRGTQPLPSPTALLKGAYGSYCTALRRTLRLPLTRETHSALCLDTAPPESCRAAQGTRGTCINILRLRSMLGKLSRYVALLDLADLDPPLDLDVDNQIPHTHTASI